MVSGESIESLALGAGLDPGTLWSHPKNAHLREQGRTPRLLHPGDEVFIPAPTPRLETTPVRTRVSLRVPARTTRLHVRFLAGGEARAHEPYTLVLDGRTTIAARTNGGGYIDHRISILTKVAELRFDADGEGDPYVMLVAHLDPLTTPSGIRQRLANLALNVEGDDADDALRTSIAAFQSREGLDVTGEPDAATRAALERAHGA